MLLVSVLVVWLCSYRVCLFRQGRLEYCNDWFQQIELPPGDPCRVHCLDDTSMIVRAV